MRHIRYLILLYILFTFHSSNGQKIAELKSFLNQKSLQKVEQFLRGYSTGTHFTHTVFSRQIIDSFYETSISFESFTTKKKDRSDLDEFNLYLLRSNDTIFYYRLDDPSHENKTRVIADYVDSSLLNVLETSYLKTYAISINQSDFFIDTVIYGSGCGFAGINPEYRKRLDRLIKDKNIAALDKWLCSTTTEIQAYAVDGFYQLKKNGYNLTSRELQLVNLIKNKKGKIRTCSGCIYTDDLIGEILKDFNF